jgi:protein-S-isoprenylcysteine O-methyltransferase Ste14
VIPFISHTISYFIDDLLDLPKLRFFNFIAIFLIPLGFLLSAWSGWNQFRAGKGTTVTMPTQKLVIEGPYTYSRNPMSFGILLFYLGIGIWMDSLSFIGLVFIFMVLLVIYIKLVEEKELEERFGEDYIDNKKRTPFLFPVPKKHS